MAFLGNGITACRRAGHPLVEEGAYDVSPSGRRICLACREARTGSRVRGAAAGSRNRERQAAMAHFYATGATLEEIATTYGVSRERVRQIIAPLGVKRDIIIDPIRILAAARAARSCASAADAAGIAPEILMTCLAELGALEEVEALWAAREFRGKYTDADLLSALRILADELGRTPGIHDINARRELPSHTTYVKRFGSIPAAQALAGLTPNQVGARGHSRTSRHTESSEICA